MIAAIPTQYNGVNFRSRLEAKWAAFFDLVSVDWSYEPIDFNGWIPDFMLQTAAGPVYAEIKPIREVCERTMSKMMRASNPKSVDVPYDLWLLGESPMDIGLPFGRRIAWYVPDCGHEIVLMPQWRDSPFQFETYIDDLACFVDGTSLNGVSMDGGSTIDRHWKQACNATQWRKPT